MDRAAAVLFADAAERARVRRFLMVSSMGADARHEGEEVFDYYLRAKGRPTTTSVRAWAWSGRCCAPVR